jgi:ABC-type multidrug transport system fused ATPase/permease subunit
LELGFNAVERVTEYASIEVEAQGGRSAPAAWPTDGRIVFENVTVAYAQDLPPVLHGLTFAVKPGERIGIVGRTGAGKSTLASVLFRLLEPRDGSVSIDGLDISSLKLEQLRSRLAIIPQDPFLFSGTLRSNLDMQGELDDAELQAALQRVHLIEPAQNEANRPSQYTPKTNGDSTMAQAMGDSSAATLATPIIETGGGAADLPDPIDPVPETEDLLTLVEETEEASSSTTAAGDSPPIAPTPPSSDLGIFSNLSMPISTGGANLSQGQRQLVCLARALLTRPKIVVLDEATSAVDRATDEVIQKSLREAFVAAGCTVLVIAHRLSTVADFDRLLVLENGRIAEIGTPRELLESGMQKQDKGKGVDKPSTDSGDAPAAGDSDDGNHSGTGAFWELVQKSAEKEKLLEMILAHESQENA